MTSEKADNLMKIRVKERLAGNYVVADVVREQLKAMGYGVKDFADGSSCLVSLPQVITLPEVRVPQYESSRGPSHPLAPKFFV